MRQVAVEEAIRAIGWERFRNLKKLANACYASARSQSTCQKMIGSFFGNCCSSDGRTRMLVVTKTLLVFLIR